MGIYAVKPLFQDILEPVASWLADRDVDPTALNLLALISSFNAALLLFLATNTYWSLVIPVLLFIRIALNALDGMVARLNDVEGQAWGEVLNETVDRVSDALIFAGLALNPSVNTTLGLITALIVVLTSFVAVASKAARGNRRYEGVMGKADRMFIIGLLGVLIPFLGVAQLGYWALIIVSAGCIETITHRLIVTHAELDDG